MRDLIAVFFSPISSDILFIAQVSVAVSPVADKCSFLTLLTISLIFFASEILNRSLPTPVTDFYSSTPTSISFDKSATVNFFPDEFCVRNSLFLSKYFA